MARVKLQEITSSHEFLGEASNCLTFGGALKLKRGAVV